MALASLRSICPAVFDIGVYSCTSRAIFKSFVPHSVCSRSTYSTTANLQAEDAPISDSDKVNQVFVNRNPRNLELMGIARKRKGWRFQYPSVEYYHRLIFEKSKRHIAGYVEHTSGKVVISASSKEYAIAKHLYSPSDKSAALNVGKVLAQRCAEAGIMNMVEFSPEVSEESDKYQEFVKAMKNGGVELSELEELLPEYEPGIDYENDFEYEDLLRRQNLARNSKSKVQKLQKLRKKNKVNTEVMLESEDPLYEQKVIFAKWNRSKWAE